MENLRLYLKKSFNKELPNLLKKFPFLAEHEEFILQKFIIDVEHQYIFLKVLESKNEKLTKSQREKIISCIDDYSDSKMLNKCIKLQLSQLPILLSWFQKPVKA